MVLLKCPMFLGLMRYGAKPGNYLRMKMEAEDGGAELRYCHFRCCSPAVCFTVDVTTADGYCKQLGIVIILPVMLSFLAFVGTPGETQTFTKFFRTADRFRRA